MEEDEREIYCVVSAGWNVEREGFPGVVSTHDKRKDALVAAHAAAQSAHLGRVTVYRENGTLECEYTYGQDPWRTAEGFLRPGMSVRDELCAALAGSGPRD